MTTLRLFIANYTARETRLINVFAYICDAAAQAYWYVAILPKVE